MLVPTEKISTLFGEGKLKKIIYSYIILHNIIWLLKMKKEQDVRMTSMKSSPRQPIEIGGDEYMDRWAEIRSTKTFHNICIDLVEHILRDSTYNLNFDHRDDSEDEFSDEDFI